MLEKALLVMIQGNVLALMLLGDLRRSQAALQKNIEGRTSEGQKALDAYQKALQANALDDSVQARMGMALDVMQKYPGGMDLLSDGFERATL